jgi:hypothetical protein
MGASAQLEFPEWKFVLRLADMWALDALRAAAIAQLDAQLGWDEATERLQIAYAYKIPRWIAPAVRQLVVRRNSLTAADIRALEPEVLAKVLAIRDINTTAASPDSPYLHGSGPIRYRLCENALEKLEEMFGADAAQ